MEHLHNLIQVDEKEHLFLDGCIVIQIMIIYVVHIKIKSNCTTVKPVERSSLGLMLFISNSQRGLRE